MSFVNYHTKEINCKVVYYGPGLGGKTTNIQHVYQKTSMDNKSKWLRLIQKMSEHCFLIFCL